MQSSGADRPVLARKLSKDNGAKGSSYPVLLLSQPENGRNKLSKTKPYSISKKSVMVAWERVKANKGSYGII